MSTCPLLPPRTLAPSSGGAAAAPRAAGPHAVIHVGPPKTGTSHLQDFFTNNLARLRTHGWSFPYLFGGGENGWCRSALFHKNGYELNKLLNTGGFSRPGEKLEDEKAAHENTSKVADENAALLAFFRHASSAPWWCPGLDAATRQALRDAKTTDDLAAVVKRWWAREFARVASGASGAPNLLLSDEGFHTPAESYAAFFGPALKAAGFARVTVVSMYRTPRVAFARSGFNQGYETYKARGYLLLPPVLTFNERVDAMVEHRHLQARALLSAYSSSAGFDVVNVDLAGVAAAGLDEADVVACEVMGLPCTAEGKWPAGTATVVTNARQSTPDRTAEVAAAYYRWQAGRAKCALPTHEKIGAFFDALEKELGPLLTAADEVCTDYTALETRALAKGEAVLDAAACVLHRVEGRVPAPAEELTYCSLDPGRLAGRPDVVAVFARFCVRVGGRAAPLQRNGTDRGRSAARAGLGLG